ncbi:MAG TPA: hypothetical protein VIV60_29215 [Polyangiaceae bacterium]
MPHLFGIATFCCAAIVIGFAGYELGQVHAAGSPARPLVRPPVQGNGETVTAPEERASRAEAAIARLEQRLQSIELRLNSTNADERRLTDVQPSARATQADFETSLENERAKETEVNAAIAETLRTEARDRNWASATENQLRDAVKAAADEGAQFSIKTVKCLTSICELVLLAAAPEQLRNSVLQVGHRFIGMSGFNVQQPETAADGTSAVTFRLFREGYAPPLE